MGRGVGTDVAPIDGIQNRTTRDGPHGGSRHDGTCRRGGISGYFGPYGRQKDERKREGRCGTGYEEGISGAENQTTREM